MNPLFWIVDEAKLKQDGLQEKRKSVNAGSGPVRTGI